MVFDTVAAAFSISLGSMTCAVPTLGTSASVFAASLTVAPRQLPWRLFVCVWQIVATRLIAKMPMIAAMVYRSDLGLPVVYPDYDRSFSENLLMMMFKNPMRNNYPALMDPPTFE